MLSSENLDTAFEQIYLLVHLKYNVHKNNSYRMTVFLLESRNLEIL